MPDEHEHISAQEYETWVTPNQALRILGHIEIREAIIALFTRIQYGELKTAARSYIWKSERIEFVILPRLAWITSETGIVRNGIWQTGDIMLSETVDGPGYRSVATVLLPVFGVRFDPAGIREMIPANTEIRPTGLVGSEPATQPSAQTGNPGGRPSKAWWDDLWVEMARQLYAGELFPKRQADIEKAMADWVFALDGVGASEQTFRPAARKLWKAINREGKN